MDTPPRLIGFGAGGHAKCVIDAVLSTDRVRVGGLVDAAPHTWGRTVLGVHVLGGPALLPELLARGYRSAFIGVGGIPDTSVRRIALDALLDTGFTLPPITHGTAVVSRFARLGEGAQVLAGSVVNADSALGDGSVVGAGVVVGHDAQVGPCAHIASGARIGGNAVIGAGALVGSGAVVLQGVRVGDGAVIGAGAVVTSDLDAGATVIGPRREVAA